MCWTAYIEKNNKIVDWITRATSEAAIKDAEKYCNQIELKDYRISVEETTDKYEG